MDLLFVCYVITALLWLISLIYALRNGGNSIILSCIAAIATVILAFMRT